MRIVFTVGCEIPGGVGQYIDIDSRTSLLDADFVLFTPTLGLSILDYTNSYQGKPSLSDYTSFQIQDMITHWRRELRDFLNAGKTVFVIMSEREDVYVSTGKKEYSGTGRNRQTTHIVRPLTNYEMLPFSIDIVESKGTFMKLNPNGELLREYWKQFGAESKYKVRIEASEILKPLLVTRNGDRTVGAVLRTKAGGALVALPWIDFDRESFVSKIDEDGEYKENRTWKPEAKEWGKRYFKALECLDEALRSQNQTTPIPNWAQDDKYKTNKEVALSGTLAQMQTEIVNLEQEREKIKEELAEAGFLKGLLYEQGNALEEAVLEAMRLMGFKATPYRVSDSEFDAVLECSDGRCIGEVEGRDNKPISIDKMRQLMDNIHDDLSRDVVSEPAKAVLFGNAYRLMPPTDRPNEHFTEKCVKAAKRHGAALVRTCDLYDVATSLIDWPNLEFAALCRKAILNSVGEVVCFPSRAQDEASECELPPDPTK